MRDQHIGFLAQAGSFAAQDLYTFALLTESRGPPPEGSAALPREGSAALPREGSAALPREGSAALPPDVPMGSALGSSLDSPLPAAPPPVLPVGLRS